MADTSQPTPRWRMVLCTQPQPDQVTPGLTNFTVNSVKVGEIMGARERVFSFNLNKPSTIIFKQDLLAPQATTLLQQKEGLILLYRNNVLQMTAEVTSLELNGADGEHDVAVTATETMWPRLQNRLLGGYGGTFGSTRPLGQVLGPTAATDQGTWLVTTQLALLNTSGSSTGIGPGSVTASGNISGGVWYFKPYMEMVQELSATSAGFDFWQTPLDPTANSNKTGNLNIAPLKGSSKPNVVFEFGTGRANALGYKYMIDNSMLANQVWIAPSEWPNSAGLVGAFGFDSTSIGVRGFREIGMTVDINQASLRSALAQQTATVRAKPREQFFIQPAVDDGTGRVPQFSVDYTTGDIIRGRVMDQGVLFLDANVRVYGVSVALDDQGQEIPTLTLVNEA